MKEISKETIKRLKNIQGTDPGIFVLSLYSVIEAYLRESLDNNDDDESFYDLLYNFRTSHDELGNLYQLFRNLGEGKKLTNDVRHQFASLDVEQANSNLSLFLKFVKDVKIPNANELSVLNNPLVEWDNRKSPSETAFELKKAIDKLQRLQTQNEDMYQKVHELESLQKQNREIQRQLEELGDTAYQRKEKIDQLRGEKRDAVENARKAQKEIQEKMKELESAELYIRNLKYMTFYTRTRYDYEKNLLHLTNEQKSIVNMVNFDKDFLIKGSAGTGKSLVLLKTLEKLIKENDASLFDKQKKIKFITYTKSLEKYNKYIADLMKIENISENEIILTSDSFVYQILTDAFPGKRFIYNDNELKSLDIYATSLGKNILKELNSFILANDVSKEEYCDKVIERTGMGNPQNKESRKNIWEAVEKIFDFYDNSNLISVNYGIYKVLDLIKKGEYEVPERLATDYLFVDEAQDLNVSKLKLLRCAVKGSMILAGDNDQAIFQPGFKWNRAGINIAGTTRILKTNFRSTDQINSIAEEYRKTIRGYDEKNEPDTFRLGPPVELHESDNIDGIYQNIISMVQMCLETLSYEPENICIIAPKKDKLESLQKKLKEELNINSQIVSDSSFDFKTSGLIRLATEQSCKGLDFPVVLFLLDHRVPIFEEYDDGTKDKMYRNMIYTSITRSTELLHIFMLKNCSEGPIGDLKKILKKTELSN